MDAALCACKTVLPRARDDRHPSEYRGGGMLDRQVACRTEAAVRGRKADGRAGGVAGGFGAACVSGVTDQKAKNRFILMRVLFVLIFVMY